jgi:hypothetical protein
MGPGVYGSGPRANVTNGREMVNKLQRIVLSVTALAIGAFLIYPPFHYVGAGSETRSFGYEHRQR